MGSVASAVRELQAPGAAEGAAQELAAVLFHAVHFARADYPVYLLETAATRHLIEGEPGVDPTPPAPAGYLQLPQHLVWTGGAAGGVPESIDGVFWFASDTGTLHVLPVTGVLPDMCAFQALPLPEAPLGHAGSWLQAEVRGSGRDFASSLPGHELDGLYSIETAGEVLKLVARFFAYLQAVPEARQRGEQPKGDVATGGTPGARGPGGSAPRPSRLAFTVVKLVA
jgi:hypothetical protein